MPITITPGNSQNLSTPVNPATASAPTGKDQPVKTNAATLTSPSQAGRPIDLAVISSTSGLLAQALSGSDVRLDKVEPLQAAIAAGTYDIPAGDVADKLIASLLH